LRESDFPCIQGRPVFKIILMRWLLIRCRLPDLRPKTSPRGSPEGEEGLRHMRVGAPWLRERRCYPIPS